jgi:hypothetical protein
LRVALPYAAAALLLNLLWEAAQLPLYTLWSTATPEELALAVLRCSVSDVFIAAGSLALAVLLFGGGHWPAGRWTVVAASTIVVGITYTILSEGLNVHVRKSWAYSGWMPIVPGLHVGLSPLLQWLVVPALTLAWLKRLMRSHAV